MQRIQKNHKSMLSPPNLAIKVKEQLLINTPNSAKTTDIEVLSVFRTFENA